MRKIIAMGETILDILFKNNQPVAAVPGGSSFNSIISLGRCGLPCQFMGYTGNDLVGRQTVDFLHQNGVGTRYFEQRENEKSAISLAFLNQEGDANYIFYKPIPTMNEECQIPDFQRDDILLFGSYYACCQGMRPQITQVLEQAFTHGAIAYYDINFRKSHQAELEELKPNIEWNMRHSTIVRGSADDFEIMFGTRDATEIYTRHMQQHCPIFICTSGAGLITICTPQQTLELQTPVITDVVSTVGAGDNFNAGLIYGLVTEGINEEQLPHLDAEQWKRLMAWATAFAGEACRSTNNYIDHLPQPSTLL